MARKNYLINNLKKSNKHDGVTLVCTFSRRIFVEPFFKAFGNLKYPNMPIHLLVYDNTEDSLLEKALISKVSALLPFFASVRLFKSYLKGRGNIQGSGNEHFRKSKLFNIWRMWLRLKKMIHTPYMFVLEDDTIYPPNAFQRLLGLVMRNSRVGFATAIETGRFSYPWLPVRLGVHKIKMQGMKVIERCSLSPNLRGLQEIDASGVYCFAAKTEAWLSGFHGYDPIALHVPFFALDNVLTWNMKQHGWRLLADFSLWCSHLEATSGRIIAFSKAQAVEMADIWLPQYKNYAHGVVIKHGKFAPTTKPALSWEI